MESCTSSKMQGRKQILDKELVELVFLPQASKPRWELPSMFSQPLGMEVCEHAETEANNIMYAVCFVIF